MPPSGMRPPSSILSTTRSYWARALERYPDLRFEPISELYGVGSVALHYRGVGGVTAAEILELGSSGLVVRAAAHYDRMP